MWGAYLLNKSACYVEPFLFAGCLDLFSLLNTLNQWSGVTTSAGKCHDIPIHSKNGMARQPLEPATAAFVFVLDHARDSGAGFDWFFPAEPRPGDRRASAGIARRRSCHFIVAAGLKLRPRLSSSSDDFLSLRYLPQAKEGCDQFAFAAHNHFRETLEPLAVWNVWLSLQPRGEKF